LRHPPTTIERGLSFRTQVWTRLINPTTWTGLVYLFVQFPIGIAAFVGFMVIGAVFGAFVAAPVLLNYGADEIDLGFRVFTQPGEAMFLVRVGVLALLAGIHLVNVASALHASWTRLMLGSRAKRVPTVTPTPEGPRCRRRTS
jgi:hypothetical protein